MDPTPIAFIAIMLLGMYFLVIRPQRRRQAAHQKTVEALAPGARVMLASGVYATIASVGEKTLRAEIAPGVRIEVLKQAVAEVVETASGTGDGVDPASGTSEVAEPAPGPTAPAPSPTDAASRADEPAGTDPDDPTKPSRA